MDRHILVGDLLADAARRFPAKTALVTPEGRFSYGELAEEAARLAGFLSGHGVGRGDRVAVFMENRSEAVTAIFAALSAGAAFIVINPTTKSRKFEYVMNNSRARALFTQETLKEVVLSSDCPGLETVVTIGDGGGGWFTFEEARREGGRVPESGAIDLDLAALIYTSGSTGFPKGVMVSHRNVISAAHSIVTYLENTPEDVIINVLPLSFDYGLYQIFTAFMSGAGVVLERSFAFPAQVLMRMAAERVTGFPGVPTIFALLLRMGSLASFDLESLRYITNTAAALPANHIRRLRDLFPRARIFSMYGLTECKRVSYLPPEEIDRRPGSVGKGMPNEEVYLVDADGSPLPPGHEGELVIRGSNVMMGYWEDPEATAACLKPGRYPGERVLYSGDIFRTDSDGYLYFVGRKDDIIKSRGEKVSPREVEEVIHDLEGVAEAIVVGVPDPILGQAIKAFVVVQNGWRLTERRIRGHCARNLESFMVPRDVELVPCLPKTPSGKVSRRLLARAADCGAKEEP